jgi:hypothetical protein
MAVLGNSCFLLVNFENSFSSETAWPNDMKLGKKHLSFGSFGKAVSEEKIF